MSPVAVANLTPRHSFSHPKTPTEGDRVHAGRDIPRRPSPWHDLAHSLSELPSPVGAIGIGNRRLSSPSPSPLAKPTSSSIPSPGATTPLSLDPATSNSGATPPLSSSQAMRDWERSTEFRRHQLIHTPPHGLSARTSSTSLNGANAAAPKLEPERDKDGHIEYKLKLIDPSPDRFERLVTQMLWRLKQGRNEAIYEIGLADDGTVIGLTRAEMDASLKTLELMASEVGATVIVLKEILLSGPRPFMRAFSTSGASTSSARSRSGSSTTSASHNESGEPVDATPKRARKGKKKKNRPTVEVRARTISSSSRGSSSDVFEQSPRVAGLSHKSSFDDSVPFQLDLEDIPLTPKSRRAGDQRFDYDPRAGAGENDSITRSKKFSAKAARSAQRKEQRRLDLIRGDGTNPVWVEMASSLHPDPLTARSLLPPNHSSSAVRTVSTLPAQPSSLRLTSTADSSPDDQFLADLWRLPLDNLSLSFADVCTVTDPAAAARSLPSSDSTDTEHAVPLGQSLDEVSSPPTSAVWNSKDAEVDKAELDEVVEPTAPSGEERICVEALIVRKSGGEGWCGGEDDGWGFGEDDEEEEEELVESLSAI